MEQQHTPGPWQIGEADDGFFVANGVDHDICQRVNTSADARLIAAAPDLLEALWAMVTSFHAVEYMESHMQDSANMARAAIAKATGEYA